MSWCLGKRKFHCGDDGRSQIWSNVMLWEVPGRNEWVDRSNLIADFSSFSKWSLISGFDWFLYLWVIDGRKKWSETGSWLRCAVDAGKLIVACDLQKRSDGSAVSARWLLTGIEWKIPRTEDCIGSRRRRKFRDARLYTGDSYSNRERIRDLCNVRRIFRLQSCLPSEMIRSMLRVRWNFALKCLKCGSQYNFWFHCKPNKIVLFFER